MKKIIYISLALLFGLTACEKLVEIDLPAEVSTITIESQISNQIKPWSVNITKTQAFNDQDTAMGVETATVTISDDLGNTETLVHLGSGKYRTVNAKQCIPGRTYTLDVSYEGKVFSATEKCREQLEIDTFLAYFLPENNGFIEKGWYAFEVAQEWEEPGDYYQWKIYRNDTLLDGFGYLLDEDKFRDQGFFNMFVDPMDPLASVGAGRLPRPFPFKFNPKDEVYLEQYAISKEYYNFLIQLQTQQGRSGTPFDPPPYNPINNISNGAYGFFSVVNIVTAQTVIVE